MKEVYKQICLFVLKTKEIDEETIKRAFREYLKGKGKGTQYEQTRMVRQLVLLSHDQAFKNKWKQEYIAPNDPPFAFFYFSFEPSLQIGMKKVSKFWNDFQLGEVLPADEFRNGEKKVVNVSSLNNNDSNKRKHDSVTGTTDKKILDCREEGQEEEGEDEEGDDEDEDDEEDEEQDEEGQKDEDEDEGEMKTRYKGSSTRLKKWAFQYDEGHSADDVWKDLKKALEGHEKRNENRSIIQGAIINTKEKHVFIEFTTFIDRSFLEKVPAIMRTSIDKWETPKINIMTLSNGFFKENGYEPWPRNQHREEPRPTVIGAEEQVNKNQDSSLFSLLNDESSFQILFSLSTGKTIRNILDDCYEHSQLRVLQFLCGELKDYFKKYERYVQSKLPK